MIKAQSKYFLKLLEEDSFSSQLRADLANMHSITIDYDPVSTPRVIAKTVIKIASPGTVTV